MTGGALEASVTLEELCTVLGTKRVPMAPELAGYIVLEVAEHADPLAGEIDPKSVYVGEEGTVGIVQPKRDKPTGDAESSVRAALARLLEASGSQTPALAAASKRAGGGGLRALVAELEAALIPVNRAAGRRALARLAREAKRAALGLGRHTLPSSSEVNNRASARSSASGVDHAPESRPTPNTQTNVDAMVAHFSVSSASEPGQARELRAIAGITETPPPPQTMGDRSAPTEEVGPLPQFVEEEDNDDVGENLEIATTVPLRTAEDSAISGEAASSLAEGRPRQARWRAIVGAMVVAGIAGIAGGAALATRAIHRRAQLPSPIISAVPAPSYSAAVAPPPCRGLIVVSDVPRHAEVLYRLGQAPLDVERMPIGARLEFVATADSHVPKRLVVPAGAEWTAGPDRVPLFSASVELERSHTRPGANDPWPFGEPGSEVGGRGPPGIVRLVVVPAGADVWMLSGLGPEARLEASCDRSTDVLVAGPTTFRKQLHVKPSDFVMEPPGSGSPTEIPARIARVTAK